MFSLGSFQVLRDTTSGPKSSNALLETFGAHVVRWEPWHGDSALNRSGPLHLDARLHPERRQSVVLHLTGMGKAEDGATVLLGSKVIFFLEVL